MDIRINGARSLRLGVAVAALLLACSSLAQNPPAAPPPDTTQSPPAAEGKDIGGYHVTQSIEIGGRISDVNGSQAMYDTLVNYQTGRTHSRAIAHDAVVIAPGHFRIGG
jgi:outer membrane biogenesis lipoprotein LolB